jgi:NAD(P)H-hydrate repair Nnr-like enzyme with NAD(P)H-hydrate epimerase domain
LKNKTDLRSVFILAGSGDNGGGAMVCVRLQSNIGLKVTVAIAKPRHKLSQITSNQ